MLPNNLKPGTEVENHKVVNSLYKKAYIVGYNKADQAVIEYEGLAEDSYVITNPNNWRVVIPPVESYQNVYTQGEVGNSFRDRHSADLYQDHIRVRTGVMKITRKDGKIIDVSFEPTWQPTQNS